LVFHQGRIGKPWIESGRSTQDASHKSGAVKLLGTTSPFWPWRSRILAQSPGNAGNCDIAMTRPAA
jgi:hypothetical protein